MASRPILSSYGPDSSQPQAPSASNGGKMPVSDVMGYSPPYGPKGINDSKGPGIHGRNSGNANQPTATSDSGTAISGSTNHGCCGSQGRY